MGRPPSSYIAVNRPILSGMQTILCLHGRPEMHKNVFELLEINKLFQFVFESLFDIKSFIVIQTGCHRSRINCANMDSDVIESFIWTPFYKNSRQFIWVTFTFWDNKQSQRQEVCRKMSEWRPTSSDPRTNRRKVLKSITMDSFIPRYRKQVGFSKSFFWCNALIENWLITGAHKMFFSHNCQTFFESCLLIEELSQFCQLTKKHFTYS